MKNIFDKKCMAEYSVTVQYVHVNAYMPRHTECGTREKGRRMTKQPLDYDDARLTVTEIEIDLQLLLIH